MPWLRREFSISLFTSAALSFFLLALARGGTDTRGPFLNVLNPRVFLSFALVPFSSPPPVPPLPRSPLSLPRLYPRPYLPPLFPLFPLRMRERKREKKGFIRSSFLFPSFFSNRDYDNDNSLCCCSCSCSPRRFCGNCLIIFFGEPPVARQDRLN